MKQKKKNGLKLLDANLRVSHDTLDCTLRFEEIKVNGKSQSKDPTLIWPGVPSSQHSSDPPRPSPISLKGGGSKFQLPPPKGGDLKNLKKGVDVWCRGRSS